MMKQFNEADALYESELRNLDEQSGQYYDEQEKKKVSFMKTIPNGNQLSH